MLLRCSCPVAVFALVAIGASPVGGEVTDRVSRVVPVVPGSPIRIEATIADLVITGSQRADVKIDIVRRAPASADLAKFPVAIDAQPRGLDISILQEHEGRDPALKSSIQIAAPLDAVFQAIRVFEGRVQLANLKAACDVDVRRGAIEAAGLAGRIRLETGIGSIDLGDSELTPGGMMRLRVFNGPIRVRFQRPPASGRILALTFNGAITSDIPLTMKDRFGPRFGESTLGSGEPVLSMDVVTGDISVTVGKD